jgi:hypothetical protein
MDTKKFEWKKKSIIILIATFILSLSLNVILSSLYLAEEKVVNIDVIQDERYEDVKLNDRILNFIEDRPFRIKIDFFQPEDIDDFRNFSHDHGLKPVISLGVSSDNKREIDDLFIKKYNLKEGEYIMDVSELDLFLQKYSNESWIMGDVTFGIENGKLVHEDISVGTTSNITKQKIKELIKDNRVRAIELDPIFY